MLAFERAGSGIPIVFLHAFPLSRKIWAGDTAAFSKNFEFITIDLTGFGDSPLFGDNSTMGVMAQEIVLTLDHLDLKQKCLIAGQSMGGYAMLPLLALAPHRFRAAAFFSTKSAPDSPEGREKRFKNIEFVQKEGMAAFADRMVPSLLGKTTLAERPAVVELLRSQIRSAKPEAVCAALRGMAARPDTGPVLDSLRIPSLFLAGEEDTIILPAEMEAMAKKVPNSEFHVIPKAGHLFNLEQPAPFHDLFLHFLKRRVL